MDRIAGWIFEFKEVLRPDHQPIEFCLGDGFQRHHRPATEHVHAAVACRGESRDFDTVAGEYPRQPDGCLSSSQYNRKWFRPMASRLALVVWIASFWTPVISNI
jgi:hypothetical protein